MNLTKIDFGLYIHWPFCLKKCPYCDFNSYALQYKAEEWVKALIKELEVSAEIFNNYKIKTIFFGGGTPSLIPHEYIKLIIDRIYELWEVNEKAEVSIEVNPSSIEITSLEGFLRGGVNRFSIGIQSLRDEKLQFLGRLHNSAQAIEILKQARSICDNVSADFMYSLPSDSVESWKRDLSNILNLASEINLKHLSLYQLTIEPNTAFEQMVRTNEFAPMEQDLQSVLYKHTYEELAKNNWNFYEISNAAKIENVPHGTIDWRSQHNLGYWKYLPYLGVGPGAHSRMHLNNQRLKFQDKKAPNKWLEMIENLSKEKFFESKEEFEVLTKQEEFQEKMLMGLRLSEGVQIEEKEWEFINKEKFELLIDKKFITKVNNSEYFLPFKGRLRLDSILKMILV